MQEPQELIDYRRIRDALEFIDRRSGEQPTLLEVATEVGVSQFHLQRLFSRWAGISPSKFLRAVTLERAREALSRSNSVLESAFSVGLSGNGKLYDLTVTIEGVTPGELRTGGVGVRIRWGVGASPFGYCFVAMTERGLCRLEFHDEVDERGESDAISRLRSEWPNATIESDQTAALRLLRVIFEGHAERLTGSRQSLFELDSGRPRGQRTLSLTVKGTNFQIQVWRALLAIPTGALASYGEVASVIGRPRATRAVGTAMGRNPVAYIIPCHRVIRSIGQAGGYRWGSVRKRVLIGRELGSA